MGQGPTGFQHPAVCGNSRPATPRVNWLFRGLLTCHGICVRRDNKLILSSLNNGPLRDEIERQGGLKLIYIDPPFDVGADFSMDIEIGDDTFTKRPIILEKIAYRDTWGSAGGTCKPELRAVTRHWSRNLSGFRCSPVFRELLQPPLRCGIRKRRTGTFAQVARRLGVEFLRFK